MGWMAEEMGFDSQQRQKFISLLNEKALYQ
jgi:hypothetical protein